MKNTKKITLCGVMAALAVVIMLTAYFPYLTYAIPAVAGIFVMIPAIECGKKWGYMTYLVAAAISLVACEMEAKLLFTVFLGFYPILKMTIDKIKSRPINLLIKLAAFNLSLGVFYLLVMFVVDLDPADYSLGFKYSEIVLALAANIVFVIYDSGLTQLVTAYYMRYHEMVRKMLK